MDYHHAVQHGSTEPPEFNEDLLCIPKRQKRVLGKQKGPDANRGQDLTSHQGAPSTSKPSSPSEESNSRILRGYCGAEGFGKPGPVHIKPRPMPRKKKRLRMSKEGPSCWRHPRGPSCPRPTKVMEGESSTPSKTALLVVPNKRTNIVGQL